jgi:putative acetyltransferase
MSRGDAALRIATEGRDSAAEIVALFTASFTASEGAAEGRLIGGLTHDLLVNTPEADRVVYTAREGGVLAGCIVFSRMRYDGDDRSVFLLAPVAVAPDRQGRGVGQRLLAEGLDAMAGRGVDVALTYGSPDYYGRVGFRPISEEQARAPCPLSYPEGWLARPLSDRPFAPLKGAARCVAAFDNPDYW